MSTTPSSLAAVSGELSAAREHVRLGHLQEAEQAFHRVLAGNPDQAEALRFLANAALARGNPAAAVQMLAHAAESDRNDPGLLLELGAAYCASGRFDAARYVLERATGLDGTHRPSARLLLGQVLELDQRPELALLHYFRAILEAQRAGQWLADDSTEPGLRKLVRHAMGFVARERRALFERGLQPLRGDAADGQLQRIDRALAIYLRERDERPADPLQQPTFLYVPGLATTKFIDPARCAWLDACTHRVAALGAEVDACAQATHATPTGNPFSLGVLQAATTPDNGAAPRWRRLPVYQRGVLQEPARLHTPQLLAALDAAPMVRVPGHGPDAEIILLQRDSAIEARYGRSNARPLVVIALDDSADFEVHVGGEQRSLQPGHALVFDPTFGYAYAHHGDGEARAVALEVWHPDLAPIECRAIAALGAAAVDFDGKLQELA